MPSTCGSVVLDYDQRDVRQTRPVVPFGSTFLARFARDTIFFTRF